MFPNWNFESIAMGSQGDVKLLLDTTPTFPLKKNGFIITHSVTIPSFDLGSVGRKKDPEERWCQVCRLEGHLNDSEILLTT